MQIYMCVCICACIGEYVLVYMNMHIYMQDLLACHTHVKNGASKASAMRTEHAKRRAMVHSSVEKLLAGQSAEHLFHDAVDALDNRTRSDMLEEVHLSLFLQLSFCFIFFLFVSFSLSVFLCVFLPRSLASSLARSPSCFPDFFAPPPPPPSLSPPCQLFKTANGCSKME